MGGGQSQAKAKKFQQILERSHLESIYHLPSAPVIKVKSRKPAKSALRLTLETSPIEGENEEVVNALAEWPNSAHGLLTINYKKKTSSGKGIMIGPNIVLTAGHNLYDYDTKTYADLKSMKFSSAAFGSVDVEKCFVSPNYIKEQKENYGILILSQSIGEAIGYFGLNCLEPQEIETKNIVIGIPQDKIKSERAQNGDIVWYQEGEDYYACGVYASGTQIMNMANFLTRAMYQHFHKWVLQVSLKDLLCPRNKELQLRNKQMDIECLHILMKYGFEDLTVLNLAFNQIEDEGAKVLASNTSWINLSQLDLSENNIGAEGAKELAKNTSWINLSQLNLKDNNIGTEGAKAIAQNSSWNLSSCDLSLNNIGAEGAKELGKNTSWTKLSYFWLEDNNIGAEGAKGLSQNTSWINLIQFWLRRNNIGAEGGKEFAKNTSWINLRSLNLEANNIGAEGAKGIAQNTSWVNLWWLNLQKNFVRLEAAELLRQNKFWHKDIQIYTIDC